MVRYSEGLEKAPEQTDQASERMPVVADQEAARIAANLSAKAEHLELDDAELPDATTVCVEGPQSEIAEPKSAVAPAVVRHALQAPEKDPTSLPALDASPLPRSEKPEITAGEKPSVAEKTEVTPEKENKPPIKLVLTKHDELEAPQVAAHLQDCGIVAFESFGGSPEERQKEEVRRTTFISSAWKDVKDTPEGQEITRTFEERGTSSLAVLKELQGTDKKVRLIDVDSSHPAVVLEEEEARLAQEFYAQQVNYEDNRTLGNTLTQRIKIMATSAAMREEDMADQLQEMSDESPHEKVGAVMGATHGPVTDLFDEEASAERVYTYSQNQDEHTGVLTHVQQAVLQQRLMGVVDYELFQRALLSQQMLVYAEERDETMAVREERLDRAVKNMSIAEVMALLSALDDIKANQDSEGDDHNQAENKLTALLQVCVADDSDSRSSTSENEPLPPSQDEIKISELYMPPSAEAGEGGDSGRPPETPGESAAEDDGDNPENTGRTQYQFVLVTHTPKAGKEIAAQLQDCDIIIFEANAVNEKSRREQEEIRTNIISPEWLKAATDDPEGEWAQEFSKLLESSPNDYTLATLKELLGTGKEVFLMDMAATHPQYHLLEEEKEALRNLDAGVENHASNEALRELIIRAAQAQAVAYATREAFMAERIRLIRQQRPGKKFGIVSGSMHTPLSHRFARSEDKIERAFVVPELPFAKGHSQRARYSYLQQTTRQLRVSPTGEINERLVDRAILEYTFATFRTRMDKRKSFLKGVEEALSFIDQLSDAEVADLLSQIEHIKQRRLRILAQARKGVDIIQFLSREERKKSK